MSIIFNYIFTQKLFHLLIFIYLFILHPSWRASVTRAKSPARSLLAGCSLAAFSHLAFI